MLGVVVGSTSGQGRDDRPERRVKDAALQNRINGAIYSGMDYLTAQQNPDGSWPFEQQGGRRRQFAGEHDFTGGLTALGLYALAASGMRKDDPTIQRGLKWLQRHRRPFDEGSKATYCASLLIMALTRIDVAEHRRWIHELADRIARSQLRHGQWHYLLQSRYADKERRPAGRRGGAGRLGAGRGRGGLQQQMQPGDNSNTQFAVLALWTAQVLAGYKVSPKVWRRLSALYLRTQHEDGGWGYKAPVTSTKSGRVVSARVFDSRPTMTEAGLIGFVCATAALRGGIKGLSAARKHKAAVQGMNAFIADRSAWSQMFWDYYYVYGVERVGTVLGLPEQGWYSIGAKLLVARQHEDGYWKLAARAGGGRPSHGDEWQVYETALALLFLSKATAHPITPRTVQKRR